MRRVGSATQEVERVRAIEAQVVVEAVVAAEVAIQEDGATPVQDDIMASTAPIPVTYVAAENTAGAVDRAQDDVREARDRSKLTTSVFE